MPTFPTIDDYYNDNPARRHSPEADYGVHWKLDGWLGTWRVSYIRATGEVYTVHLDPRAAASSQPETPSPPSARARTRS